MSLDTILESISILESTSLDTLLIAFLYLSFSILFLLVLPALVYAYLNKRWCVASSIERLGMYFMVFFCFPGMLLLSPFLNFRPQRREIKVES